MASPFSIFRKHQKVLMAAVTLMAIFAFVFLGSTSMLFAPKDPGAQNKVVVKTAKYGDLRESNLDDLKQRREKIRLVLGDLLQQRDVVKQSGMSPEQVEQLLRAILGPPSEQSVVESWLLARHAEELGIVISDEAVNRFLITVTQDIVKRADIELAFRRAGVSTLHFFQIMREELAVQTLRRMFGFSLEGLTPGQRWDYFNRVNQLAKIEAAPVSVAGYIKDISDPSDEELTTFFEKHKEQYPKADSPEPGFREPKRVALQYFKADMEKFVAQVTDDEIKQQYEKNKEFYDQIEKKAEPAKAEKAPAAVSKDVNANKDKTGGEKAPDAQEKPAEAKEPDKAPVPAGQPAPANETKSKDTSAVVRPSPFRLTALSADESLSGEEKASEKSPEKGQTPPADKSDSAAKDSQSAVKQPSAAESKASEKTSPPTNEPQPKPPAAEQKTAEKPADQKPDEKAPAAKAGMSDSLRLRIRQELGYQKISKIFAKLHVPMDEYHRKWVEQLRTRKDAEGKGSGDVSVPAPDFAALAKENGLTTATTELMSQWDAVSTEIGATYVEMREPVWRLAFSSLAKFYPVESMGLMKGDRYLFWKTEETKDKIPTFTDAGVRERVLAEWKLVQARPLALKKAEALAAEAGKSGKPLKDAFGNQPDLRVITPPPFAWMTFGSVASAAATGAARINDVEGVKVPGEDFMRAVFNATPGQTVTAFDGTKTDAYVIRVLEFTPSEEALWKQFETDGFGKYLSIAQEDRQETLQAWLDEIKKSAGLVWERKPVQTDYSSRVED